MTAQPTRDQLRALARDVLDGGSYLTDEEEIAMAQGVRHLLDQLDQAEARIKAVWDMCDAEEYPDQWPPRPVMHGGEPFPATLYVEDIRRALEG